MTGIERYNYAFDTKGDDWPARLLRRVPAGASVLELGPGAGAMTRALVAMGHSVTVVENDPDAVHELQSLGICVVPADLDDVQWSDALEGQRFGVVLACDVLEHLRGPQQVLAALTGLLEPEGRLVISVPNIAYAGILAALRLGVFEYADKGLLDRTHVHFFTRCSIEAMLLDSGWAPRKWEANRVPIARSEFIWHWENLPLDMRTSLLQGWTDSDVYQWMVEAVPLLGVANTDLVELRSEGRRLRGTLQALELKYEAEHASLLEHQKAFSEAKQIIEKFESDSNAMKDEIIRLTEIQAQLNIEASRKSYMERWRRLLKKFMRLD